MDDSLSDVETSDFCLSSEIIFVCFSGFLKLLLFGEDMNCIKNLVCS